MYTFTFYITLYLALGHLYVYLHLCAIITWFFMLFLHCTLLTTYSSGGGAVSLCYTFFYDTVSGLCGTCVGVSGVFPDTHMSHNPSSLSYPSYISLCSLPTFRLSSGEGQSPLLFILTFISYIYIHIFDEVASLGLTFILLIGFFYICISLLTGFFSVSVLLTYILGGGLPQ